MCEISRENVGRLREVFPVMLESKGFPLSSEGLLDLNARMDVKSLFRKIISA